MISLINAIQARRGFILVQGTLEECLGEHRVLVPKDTVFAVLPEERKAFEDPKEQTLWRVGAGGGLMVLHCTDCSVALMRYRDKDAPSYGDHWTLGSGLTASVEEIINPLLVAVRECVEEFGVVTPRGIILPTFNDDELDGAVRGAVRSSAFLHQRAALSGLVTDAYLSVDASFGTVQGEETLTVAFESADETNTFGIVAIDPNTRGIDLLKVINVKVPYRLEEIAIVDGEEGKDGKALNAPVGCMNIDNLVPGRQFDVVFQHGDRQDPTGYVLKNMTPVLQTVIERLVP
ncbi:MAG: hypothetical protein WC790_03755 [Candidatus Paceibacterota bacterium]|jgi:hypothetical protein